MPIPLTERQRRFADEYALCGNATEAARRAGYCCAKVAGSRLLSNVAVSAAIQARQQVAAQELALTRDKVIAELKEAIRVAKAQGNAAAMIAGWREIAKMCGFYEPERVAVHISGDALRRRSKYEALSDEELFRIATARVVN